MQLEPHLTPSEHYSRAEDCLNFARDPGLSDFTPGEWIAVAHVHALLANATGSYVEETGEQKEARASVNKILSHG